MPTRLLFALIALLLLITLPNLAGLYTDWLWFGETGYQGVFLKSLTTKALLGIVVFVAAFVVLLSNFRLALRGPTRSSHRPPKAADRPSAAMASENIQAKVDCDQSAGADSVTPTIFVNGILNTENAYTWPIHR